MKMLKGGIEIARSILMDSLIRAVEKEECAAIVSHSRLVGEGIHAWLGLETVRLRLAQFHASKWYELENGVNHLNLASVDPDFAHHAVKIHVVWRLG